MIKSVILITLLLLITHIVNAELTPQQRLAMGMSSYADVGIYLKSKEIDIYLKNELPAEQCMYLAYIEDSKHHKIQVLINNMAKRILVIQDIDSDGEDKKSERIENTIEKYCGHPDIVATTYYEDVVQIIMNMSSTVSFQSLTLFADTLCKPGDILSYSIMGKRISRSLIEKSPFIFHEVEPLQPQKP